MHPLGGVPRSTSGLLRHPDRASRVPPLCAATANPRMTISGTSCALMAQRIASGSKRGSVAIALGARERQRGARQLDRGEEALGRGHLPVLVDGSPVVPRLLRGWMLLGAGHMVKPTSRSRSRSRARGVGRSLGCAVRGCPVACRWRARSPARSPDGGEQERCAVRGPRPCGCRCLADPKLGGAVRAHVASRSDRQRERVLGSFLGTCEQQLP